MSFTILKRNLSKKKGFNNFIKSLPDKFSEQEVHVRDYLGDGVYLLKNGDLGAMFKISGIYDEVLTNKEVEEKIGTLLKSFRSIILGVPSFERKSNTVIQLHLRQRKAEEKDLFDDCHDEIKDEFLKKIIKEEEIYHFKTQKIIKRELFLSLRFVIEKTESVSYLHQLKEYINHNISKNDYKRQLEENLQKFNEELINLKHSISRDFEINEVRENMYINFIQNYFNFRSEVPVVSRKTHIHQQIILPKIKEESLTSEDATMSGAIQTDKGLIKTFYLDQLPGSYLYGQLRIFIDQLPIRDFDISWNISHGNAEFGTDLMAKEGWYTRKTSRQAEANDFASFRENINSTRPYVVQSVRLITYNLKSENEGLLQSLAMDYIGARLVKESQIPIHTFISSLPMNCLPIYNKIKGGRCKKIRLENALAFAPIYTGAPITNGVKNWISRQNSQTRFNLFSGQGNRMTAILATTRAGKSVFNANLILEFLAVNPTGIVRVIDKKSSYQKLGDLVGGRVINFSEAALKDAPYSPFALDNWDEDDIENIYLLISTAIIQKNEGIKLSACHTEVLRESIKLAYNSHLKNTNIAIKQKLEIDPHPIWSDILSQMPQVCENLRSSGVVGVDKARDDLASWSVNLYQTGQYGFLFSKHELKKNDSSKDRFITYDLDGIFDPVLRQLAAMMAFIKIGRDLAKLPRKVPKLIIFEELGMLLHGKDEAQNLMDEFVHMIIKTCAKLNAQAISITNDVKDYTEKAAGRTVWDNSSQKIFLPLGDLIDSAKVAWGEKYNEADFQILESLEKEFHLKRSQAYIYSKNEVTPYKGTLIIPLSPFMDALCTTSGPQVDLYDALRKEGLTCMETLVKMAADHPYGEQIS
jgi:type IV secretory pathway VirB4 component